MKSSAQLRVLSAATRAVITTPQIAAPASLRQSYHARTVMGDLNNTRAARTVVTFEPDSTYSNRSLAIPEHEDDLGIRKAYRPFLLPPNVAQHDWIAKLELSTVLQMVEGHLQASGNDRMKVLVLYGSLRKRYV